MIPIQRYWLPIERYVSSTFVAFEFYVILRFFKIQQYVEAEGKLILIHCHTFSYKLSQFDMVTFVLCLELSILQHGPDSTIVCRLDLSLVLMNFERYQKM